MEQKLDYILQRIDSRHLAELWGFYRNYFESDMKCLAFIYNALLREPIHNEEMYGRIFSDDNDVDDSVFIPRRMLNIVQRMVSAARDMEQIRRGKDIFKIVFLVTCVETLQKLSGKSDSKKNMLFDFFINYTSENDKKYIVNNFEYCADYLFSDENEFSKEDTFWQFISVLNEFRNCAAHEGAYWEYCFSNSSDGTPLLFTIKSQLQDGSPKKDNCFNTALTYHAFEEIFVRTSITFIEQYISSAGRVV